MVARWLFLGIRLVNGPTVEYRMMNFSTTKMTTMCQAASMREAGQAVEESRNVSADDVNDNDFSRKERVPIETVLAPPSALARYTCVSVVMAVFAVWGKFAFIDEAQVPGGQGELHSWTVPMAMTFSYLISLPLLRSFAKHFLSSNVDVKALLCESMILYNAGQVLLNGWMVYRILDAVLFRGHPFIGGPIYLVDTGASYAVWVHYLNKYLEFMDTFFMVLRGKMDQVRLTKREAVSFLVPPLKAHDLAVMPSQASGCCHDNLSLTDLFTHDRILPLNAGILLTCVPSHLHCLGLVVWSEIIPWWRHLLWCFTELLDSRHDVFILYFEPAED